MIYKTKFIYLFIYRATNLYITMKLYINYLGYLKYLYKKIVIFVISELHFYFLLNKF